MGEPITWRTVVGNSLENAWRPMAGAVQTMDSGFDRLMKMISDRQEVNQGVEDRGQEAQVLKFKEALANARTPEEIAALQGQRDTYLAGLKPKFLGETIGAEDQRRAALYDQLPKQLVYEHSKLDEAQQGRVQEFNALLARDPAQAQFWLSQNQDLRTYGDLALKAHATAQANTKVESDRQRTAAEIQRWRDETAIGNRQVDATTRGQNIQLFGALSGGDLSGGAGGRGGAAGANGTPDGSATSLTTTLSGLFKDDPGKAQVMARLVSEAMNHPDPKMAGLLRMLPQDVLVRTVEQHMSDAGTGKYNPFDLFAVSNIRNSLVKELENPSVVQEMARDARGRIRGQERADEVANLRRQVGATLFPGSSTGQANPGSTPAPSPAVNTLERAAFNAAAASAGLQRPEDQPAKDREAGILMVKQEYGGDLDKARAGAEILRQVAREATGDQKGMVQGQLQRLEAGITAASGSAPAPAQASPAPAPAAATKVDTVLLKRRAAAEEQAIREGVIADYSPDVKAFVQQRDAEKVKADAAEAVETRKRADAIVAKQQEEFRRRQQQLSAGSTGNDVGIMRDDARVAAIRRELADATKKAR